MKSNIQRHPRFFWQAVLILLPTCVLACFAFAAILRDRAMVEADARRRAQELVQSLAGGPGSAFGTQLAPGFNILAEQSVRSGWTGRGLLDPRDQSGKPLVFPDGERELLAKLQERTSTSWPGMQKRGSITATFVLNEFGGLEWPVPYDAAPQPATWPSELSVEQGQAWQALQRADCAGTNAAEIGRLTEAFLDFSPSESAKANAELIRLRAILPTTLPLDAVNALISFARTNSRALSEAGLPLSNLAFAEALRLATDDSIRGYFWAAMQVELSEHPSVLGARLVELAGRVQTNRPYHRLEFAEMRHRWQQEELNRALADRLLTAGLVRPLSTTNFWLDTPQGRCFCLVYPDPTATATSNAPGETGRNSASTPRTIVRVFPHFVVEGLIQRMRWNLSLPNYFGVSCEVEGEVFRAGVEALPTDRRIGWQPFNTHFRNSKASIIADKLAEQNPAGSGRDQNVMGEILAEVRGEIGVPKELVNPSPNSAEFEMPSRPRYVLRVHLTDRAALFAQQRQRAIWFGALILGSVAASGIGLFTAHRAFRRQLQLNEAKSNFVSSVSHELRAPIAAVRLLAEILERGKVGETAKQREYFGFIVQECRRLSSLIENVLDFSRIEQGRKQYDFEPTDLRALAEQTVKLMEPYAAEKGVRLELGTFNIQRSQIGQIGTKAETSNIEHRTSNIERGDKSPAETLNLEPRTSNFELLADGKALQQALVNLIDNAIKHSPKGETVTVGIEMPTAGCRLPNQMPEAVGPLNSQPSTLNLFVADHGPGIPPEEHARIFERFYRRGSELRRETQGVGIGLSIVKHIVEAHGGRVIVQSAVGEGSRFTIELPLRK